jgi:uncharacterized membrane protein
MKRKALIVLLVLVLGGIMAHFLGIGIVVLALICLGLGLLIGRRHSKPSKGRDIVIRLRR